MADRVAGIFVPAVLVAALLTLFIWLLLGAPFTHALLYFVAVLIIACPCALGLATPTAIMVGTGRAAEMGMLIKGGEVLERACSLTTVVFDKTGTLTRGEPMVTEIRPAGEDGRLLRLAAAAEQGSEHPLAEAVVREGAGTRDFAAAGESFPPCRAAGWKRPWTGARCCWAMNASCMNAILT